MNKIQIANETLITPKELDKAGVISLVKQWEERKAGRLKHYRIGSKVLYSETHIKDFLTATEQNAGSGN